MRHNAGGTKRVLVEVRGGVAYIAADPGIEVCLVDYDNDPDAEIPEEFQSTPTVEVE